MGFVKMMGLYEALHCGGVRSLSSVLSNLAVLWWRRGLTEAAEETLAESMQASNLVCWPLLQELQGLVSQKNAAHGLALHLRARLGLLRLLQLSCAHSRHITVGD